MSKKRLIITSVISIVLVAVLMIGSTYSIFTTTEIDENAHVYKTGVLDVTYTLSSANVILSDSTPISDDKSCNISPYRVTVTNTGTVPYQFDVLLIDNTSTDTIDYQYIKAQVGILEPMLYSAVADNGNLIPVYYDDTNEVWKKADSNNKNNSWYDYDNKMWANAIIKDEDTIVDLSNNLNNGTNNGAKWNKSNGTITTDGVSSYVDCGLANHDFGNTITLAIRVRFDDIPSDKQSNIFGNQEYAGGGIYLQKTTNSLSVQLYDDTEELHYYNSSFVPKVDTWYTIVATYDGTIMKLYVDGVLLDGGGYETTINILASSVPFALGLNPQPTGIAYLPTAVTVSDALIFDRALAATEIASNYVDKPVVNDSTDLLLHYDFSDGDDIPVGTTISDSSDDGTIGFYVWIPRYKYRVWNITRQGGTEDTYAYPAFTKGIEIEWENGTTSTDNVDCVYDIGATESEDTLSDECTYTKVDTPIATDDFAENVLTEIEITTDSDNADYTDAWYTHPAFTFDNKELDGFWIGKFETSTDTSSTCYTSPSADNCNNADHNPKILPDVSSLRFQVLSQQFTTTKKFQNYLSSDINAHMLTNLEWGAVAYLTHSIYGLCDGISCDGVYQNNSSWFYTGRSGGAIAGSDDLNLSNVYPDDSTSTNKSNINGYYTYKGYFIDYKGNVTTTKDITKVSSTTRNITGVYDMSGGSYEYVMGNMVNSSYAFYPSVSGTNWNGSTILDRIYYNAYSFGTSYYNAIAFNRARLGDATAEVLGGKGSISAWKPGSRTTGTNSNFVYNDNSWFIRGGYYNALESSAFFIYYGTGSGSYGYSSFRSSLS